MCAAATIISFSLSLSAFVLLYDTVMCTCVDYLIILLLFSSLLFQLQIKSFVLCSIPGHTGYTDQINLSCLIQLFCKRFLLTLIRCFRAHTHTKKCREKSVNQQAFAHSQIHSHSFSNEWKLCKHTANDSVVCSLCDVSCSHRTRN